VTGIDLWSTHDQSGNSRDVTMRNASLEGVLGRIDIETGDMRALLFPDGGSRTFEPWRARRRSREN